MLKIKTEHLYSAFYHFRKLSEEPLNSSCFKITFKDQDDIELENAYPITNEEGMKLTPYTFTITNVCETHASYQINLEVLNSTTFTDLTIMNISLNEKEAKGYSTYDVTEKTLENASFSRKLENGYLYPLEEKTFTLRLWMDEDTPTEDAYMNQSFQSKVTIVTSYLKESPTYAEVITNCSKNGYRTAECMLENSKYDTVNLSYDETVDNNLRYIGSNPNNYVRFNNELWRIIGVMNNVEDANGNKDSRIKLIRDESIGSYSWDSSPSNVNEGLGINEWSQADLMKLMNPGYESESIGGSLYWNRKSGRCYNNRFNQTTSCNFTNIGLMDESKKMIEKVVWNTGSNGRVKSYDSILTQEFYEFERSENTGKICSGGNFCTNDNVLRTTTWPGYIGLMYPSDYGFSTTGGVDMDRTACLNAFLYNWKNYENCSKNDWLLKSGYNIWTMTAAAEERYANSIFHLVVEGNRRGQIATRFASMSENTSSTYPALYLKSSVHIANGNGTQNSPYELEMEV